MQKAADEGHQACHEPAKERVAATGKRSVIGETFGEGHRDSCTHGGGRADQEDSARVVGGERCREDWRQRRDGAIHEAREPGCTMRRTKLLSFSTMAESSLRLGILSDITWPEAIAQHEDVAPLCGWLAGRTERN